MLHGPELDALCEVCVPLNTRSGFHMGCLFRVWGGMLNVHVLELLAQIIIFMIFNTHSSSLEAEMYAVLLKLRYSFQWYPFC